MMRFINIFFYTIFVTLMIGVAGLLVGSMLPIPGNIELKIVKSGSMEPNIPTGSLVVVKPSSSYGIGDVVTFGADTQTEVPTTHRIVGFEADENGRSVYRTKGDANEDSDANTVARSEVIGKVVFHVPYVGFVLDFARQPLGFALLIGVPAALIILEEVMTIVKEVKAGVRRRKRKEEGEDTDEPSHGSGGTRLREVAGPEKLVYLRRRAMDEIFVPMMVETRGWIREHTPKSRDAYGAATFVVMGLVFVSTMLSGGANGTIAYFNDVERSISNMFSAAECDDFREGSCPPPLDTLTIEEEPNALRAFAVEPEAGGETGEVLGESTETQEEPATEPAEEPQTTSEEPPAEPAAPQEESGLFSSNDPITPPETASEETSNEPPTEAAVDEADAPPADQPAAEMPEATSSEPESPPEN